MDRITKSIDVLLVEDNPADVRLIMEAFKDCKISNRFHIASDGDEALNFLYNRGDHKVSPKPDLILLDINLPKRNGFDILEEIKQDDSLKSIPVIVLTTSNSDEHIKRSYKLNANCYVNKPLDFEKFLEVVKTIESFWFNVAKLPYL